MFTRVNLIYIIVVCLLNVNQAFRYKYHTNNSDISRNVLKDELFLNQSGSTKFFDKHKIESNIYSFPTKLSYNDNVMKNRNTDFNTAQDDKNYYSDWTPIISSSFKPFIPRKQFTLTLKNEPLNKKKEVDKSQQWLKDNIKENFTFSSPENSKNNKSSIKLFPYQRNSINWRNDNKSELNLTMNNFSSVKRSDKNIFTKPNITRRKTKVTLNEDDIMWMHYSLPNQNIPLIRSYQENSKNNSVMTENQENFEAEEIMKSRITDTVVEKQKEQTKQHKLEGQQFTYSADNTNFLNYIKNNTKEYRNNYQNDGKLLSHQEVYYRTKNYIKPNHVHNFSLPKNIYDVIDGKNWSDQFEPITEATNKYDSNGLEYSNDRKDVNNKFGYADILVKHRKDETKKKEDDWSTWLNLYEIKYNLNNETNEPSQRHESELFTFSPIPSVRTIMTTTSKSIIEKTLTGVSKEKNVKNYETRNLIKYDQKNNSFTNLQDENRYYVKKEDDEYDKSKRNFSQWSNGDDDKINFQNSSSIWLNENGKKDTINNSGKKKRKNLGKFLNKPIVIVESQTNLTAEYYRQLFESFGSHDDDDVDKLASSRKNLEKLPGKYMEQRESSTLFSPEANLRHENMVSLSTTAESENCNQNCVESEKCENTDKKHSPSKPGKKHSVSDIFFNITRTELGDLIPKTLKTNIYSLKHLIIECHSNSKEKRSLIMEHPFYCLKKITLDILDKAITSDVVQITDTVSLIKENHNSSNESSSRSASFENTQNSEWLSNLIEKIQKLFSSHSLKVKLMNSQKEENVQIEGRRRHQLRRIFPVVASIYMAFTAVLIPLIFQFMAMMGGKAFIIGRRRHYRRVFPIMVGAYMILSSVLMPLGFKFMTLLSAKSLLLSKLSLIMALMGGIKKYMGFKNDYSAPPSHYSSFSPYYPQVYPSYYDPWRRDEFRKISHHYEDPFEYTHFTEEVE